MRLLPVDYAIRNLMRRPLQTTLSALASTLVAAILAGTAAFVTGLEESFAGAGREDVAIVLSSVAERDVLRSTVAVAVPDLIGAEIAGIKRLGDEPCVSPEIHMGTNLALAEEMDATGGIGDHAVFIRGVTDRAFSVHDAVTLLEGRLNGSGEVLVGRLAAAKAGLPAEAFAVGRRVHFEGGTFTVSGVFAAPGTTIESEIWAPLRELQGLCRRDDLSAVFVKMERREALRHLELFAGRRLDLELAVISSAVYYRELAAWFKPIRWLAGILAVLIGFAAIFSGANALGAAVQERLAELASLRAMGFGGGALVWSLLQEATVTAAIGGLSGLGVAQLMARQSAFRIAMSAFELRIEAQEILIGFAAVLVLALVGTVPAALTVLRLEVATALKER